MQLRDLLRIWRSGSVISAAAHAQRAADYLHGLQPQTAAEQEMAA